jgi:hypothetical protein
MGPAANAPANPPPSEIGQNFTVQGHDEPDIFPLAVFSMGGDDNDYNPLRIDYSDPMFLNLNYSGKFNPLWVVFPENYTDTDWVSSKLLGRQSMRQDISNTCNYSWSARSCHKLTTL